MAKKFYHIPLQKIREFLKENKSEINVTLKDKDLALYSKEFGRTYYELEIEAFIHFFKIDANISYALKTITYFKSDTFLKTIYEQLNFPQFTKENKSITNKDIFYSLSWVYKKYNSQEFHIFVHAFMLHFFSSQKESSQVFVDYQAMLKSLVSQNNSTLKESFGEKEKKSYFRLTLNDDFKMELQGNSIKTLRKKVYKKFFLYVIDNNNVFSPEDDDRDKAHEILGMC